MTRLYTFIRWTRLLSCYLVGIGLIYCSALVPLLFSGVAVEKSFHISYHLSPFIALHVACGHVSLTRAPETKFSRSRSRDKLLQK